MMRRIRPLALLLAVGSTAIGAQDPAAAAIDRAVNAYASVKTARASFEQVVDNPLTGSKLTSRGEFEQQRPDRFAFRFSDPQGDAIISDGKFVWVYLPSSTPGQVVRAPLSADVEGSIDLIGTLFSNPRARYAIADAGAATVGGRATRVVVLTPKAKGSSGFSRAKVWIDAQDGTLRQFEAEENTGIVRTVRVTSFTPNAAVAPSSFAFKPPRGVKVVKQDDMLR